MFIIKYLGLGDIVIPGIFIALLRRFDHRIGSIKKSPKRNRHYFLITIAAYALGLFVTMAVMHFFKVISFFFHQIFNYPLHMQINGLINLFLEQAIIFLFHFCAIFQRSFWDITFLLNIGKKEQMSRLRLFFHNIHLFDRLVNGYLSAFKRFTN